DADHLVDELGAPRAIDERALIFRISLQNLVHLRGGEFEVAHLDDDSFRRNDGGRGDYQGQGDAIGPGNGGGWRGGGGGGGGNGGGFHGRLGGELGGSLGEQGQSCRI